MISKLNNKELDIRLKNLVSQERKLLHVILEHIKEVAVRRLYLEMAYPTLYEYLVKECGYSGSAAMRRISAAQLLRDVPVVAEKIQEGSLNLSQIGELSRAIKEKEKTGVKVTTAQKLELVTAISGKTTLETQKEISMALELEVVAQEKLRIQRDESVRLEVSLSKEVYEELLQCRDHAAHVLRKEYGDSSWASVFGLLVKEYAKSKKLNLEMKSFAKAADTSTDTDANSGNATPNKTLTPKTRRLILAKDQCCQFKDPYAGRICGSTYGLEVDHKTSRWAGGNHEIQNLQVLCRSHNNFKYQCEAGLSAKQESRRLAEPYR